MSAKAIVFKNGGYTSFAYPEDMRNLVKRLKEEEAEINVGLDVLETLWYAFSETWSASWLDVDDLTYSGFRTWVERITVDTATHMDVYGNDVREDFDDSDFEDEEEEEELY